MTLSSRSVLLLLTGLGLLVPAGGHAINDCKFRNDPSDVLRGAGCQIEQMTAECTDWFKKNPETLGYAKNCADPSREQGNLILLCGKDIVDSWVAIFRDYGKNYDICEKKPAVKIRLAREANYKFASVDALMSDDGPSCMALLDKRFHVREMAAKDPTYRPEGVPLPGIDDQASSSESSGDLLQALTSVAAYKMEELGVKWQCYDAKSRMRMFCTAIGTVVDPTLALGAAGLTLKGGKWAARALKGGQELKITEGIATTVPEVKSVATAAERTLPKASVPAGESALPAVAAQGNSSVSAERVVAADRALEAARSELTAAESELSQAATAMSKMKGDESASLKAQLESARRKQAQAREAVRNAHQNLCLERAAVARASGKPALADLEEHLAKSSTDSHRLTSTPDGMVLKIGELERSQKKFMGLLLKTVREGSLPVIDGGLVIGPKALSWTNSIAKYAASHGKKLTIKGHFFPQEIADTYKNQLSRGTAAKGDPNYWSPSEIEDYNRALRDLNIQDCKTEWCRFSVTIDNGKITTEYSSR